MTLPAIQRELDYLLESLPEETGPVVVVNCEPAEVFGPALGRRFSKSVVYVVIRDAQDLEFSKNLSTIPNVKITVASTLDFLPDQLANLIVLRSTGFEGKQRLFTEFENSAKNLVRGGQLFLISHKKRGANTHVAMLERVFGESEIVNRGGGGIRILSAVKKEEPSPICSPKLVLIEEEIFAETYKFYTDQAIFSKDRVDLGTRFLLENLPVDPVGRILDLGCGYGVIGIVLARRFPKAHVTLSDVDLRSVELARMNTKLNGVEDQTTTIFSNGLKEFQGMRFDLVISHFPLHIHRSEFARIIKEVHESLVKNGRIIGVALSAYDVRPTIKSVFGNIKLVAETGVLGEPYSYRVISAVKTNR